MDQVTNHNFKAYNIDYLVIFATFIEKNAFILQSSFEMNSLRTGRKKIKNKRHERTFIKNGEVNIWVVYSNQITQTTYKISLYISIFVLSSVLLCPLRFLHKHDVRFIFTTSCLQEGSCLTYVICVCLHIVVLYFCFVCPRLVHHMLPVLWIVHILYCTFGIL